MHHRKRQFFKKHFEITFDTMNPATMPVPISQSDHFFEDTNIITGSVLAARPGD